MSANNREGEIVVEERPGGFYVGFLQRPDRRGKELIFTARGIWLAKKYAAQAQSEYHAKRVRWTVQEVQLGDALA